MGRFVDLTGMRFGKLTVLSIAGKLSSGVISWNCICDCGNNCVRGRKTLRKYDNPSCGCGQNEMTWKTRKERYGNSGYKILSVARIKRRRIVTDLTNEKFGRLTVLERAENYKTAARWKCLCECGEMRIVIGRCLRSGHTKSCGCLSAELATKRHLVHGQASRKNETEEYRIWMGMTKRCRNKNTLVWDDYGGRGIEVCERWLNFDNFFSDMGKRPSKKHSIDRVDVNGNYEPSNCKWATNEEQARNRRITKVNKSGAMGVSWNKTNNKWVAYISVSKKRVHLGLFNNKEDAIISRKEAELKYWGKSS